MAKRAHKKEFLAQYFLRSSKLAGLLVKTSSIRSRDTVYEIGPGRGMLTNTLSRAAQEVVAVEKDPALAHYLRKRFRENENIRIVCADFLRHPISHTDFKIFANIPYNLTASIIRKILHGSPRPKESYLIVQKEAARKFTGRPTDTQFSILAKPFYRFRVIFDLRRTDFFPVPGVDSVLLHIKRRDSPRVSTGDINIFKDLVCCGFGGQKKNLRLNLKRIFTYPQWKRLSKDLGFGLNARPSEVSIEQWLGLFDFFKERVLPYRVN